MLNLSYQTALSSGIWGTVGPCFEKACAMVAEKTGHAYGLLLFSTDAALSVALRALSLPTGAPIRIQTGDDPMDQPPEAAALVLSCGYVIGEEKTEYRLAPTDPPLKAIKKAYTLYQGDMPMASIFAFNGAGALVTDDTAFYQKAYAYHNCGRIPGIGATTDLSAESIVGGDYRATEWQALELLELLA